MFRRFSTNYMAMLFILDGAIIQITLALAMQLRYRLPIGQSLDPETLERSISHPLDLLRPAVYTAARGRSLLAIVLKAKFRGNHHFALIGFEGFADQFFIRERAINFRCIEEGDAPVNGGVQ